MKIKKLLTFYFKAEEVQRALDRLILKRAGVDFYRTAENCAERVIALTEKKRKLKKLYNFLDGIMAEFAEDERAILRDYALCSAKAGRRGHALTVRFARRVNAGISRCKDGLEVMQEYFIG